MSLSPLSSLNTRPVFPDLRLQTNTGGGSGCMSTAFKVVSVVAGLVASIGSFALFGPLAGIIATVISGTTLLLIFNSCSGNSHNHAPSPPLPQLQTPVAHVPWYQRAFEHIPTRMLNPGDGGHAPVGRREQPQNVPVGRREQPQNVLVGRREEPPQNVLVGRREQQQPHPYGPYGQGGQPAQINNPPPSGPANHTEVGNRRGGRLLMENFVSL